MILLKRIFFFCTQTFFTYLILTEKIFPKKAIKLCAVMNCRVVQISVENVRISEHCLWWFAFIEWMNEKKENRHCAVTMNFPLTREVLLSIRIWTVTIQTWQIIYGVDFFSHIIMPIYNSMCLCIVIIAQINWKRCDHLQNERLCWITKRLAIFQKKRKKTTRWPSTFW